MESFSRSRDKQIAGVRAKAQLAHYLNQDKAQNGIELKHFMLLDKNQNGDKVIYRFKVAKKDIKIVG